MPDIREWKDIDAAWLSEALQAGGVDAKVSAFEAGKVGTGQIGDCVRFRLDYASAPPDAPATIVGKFPSEGAESRATGVQLGNYHREVKFYQLLQPDARISTPHCYFTDVNEETHDFVLMMSDLAPAEQGDQLAGVTLDQTRLVLDEAAKLHSAFWQDEKLDDFSWVMNTRNAPDPIPPELVVQLWDGFKARYGSRVTPQARQVGDAMSRNLDGYNDAREGPKCLIHSDFRPDNMMFNPADPDKPVTVVDWQSFGYGPGGADVGYFIAGAIDPETRRAHESELLDLYLSKMSTLGADDYSRDIFLPHYVAGAYQHFFTAFFAAMLVTQTPRGDDMFFRMANGAVDLIADHDALDWFN
ncbi:phosphotransferase [Henriciella litoralis]|uniref:phosphotransferase n=1 Tax=Henriciella litoralis TaxID=568102 RepID=UPI00146AC19B|nr:phosphotransferase [Henriciella litoralis]